VQYLSGVILNEGNWDGAPALPTIEGAADQHRVGTECSVGQVGIGGEGEEISHVVFAGDAYPGIAGALVVTTRTQRSARHDHRHRRCSWQRDRGRLSV